MNWIEGPTLPLLRRIGLVGHELFLATAFYSRAPLEWLAREIRAEHMTLAVRLDLKNPEPWFSGYIDPEALLAFWLTLRQKEVRVRLFINPAAHAKLYIGDCGALVGSANLTMKGFGAGPEIVVLKGRRQVLPARSASLKYLRRLREISLNKFTDYVERYKKQAHRERRKLRFGRNKEKDEDRISPLRIQGRRTFVGDYQDFLSWLSGLASPAAKEILDRARGKHNLQGHVNRSFFGLRQFFLAKPALVDDFRRESPDKYKLHADTATEKAIASFVRSNATDEPGFILNIWRSYLPKESGGRATRHGGAIGSLNRMIPLVARYLWLRSK